MNIVQLLEEREQWDVRTKRVLENALEDSFIAGNAEQFDIAMPRSVSSTIAIAMSCNGVTFATTHGDHTVKVFDFGSGQQIRNFSGHPRTPWTLKYHPTDPNIIASGCLGFQVRLLCHVYLPTDLRVTSDHLN
jgi:activator-of-BECN1-regulated-autophagy protein 1